MLRVHILSEANQTKSKGMFANNLLQKTLHHTLTHSLKRRLS